MSVALYALSFGFMAVGVCLVWLSCMALLVILSVPKKRNRELRSLAARFIPVSFIVGVAVLLAGFAIGRVAE